MATVAIRERRSALEARLTTDRDVLRAFLEQDRRFAAYALADLDDREFSRTRWGLALEAGRPIAVALEYAGTTPQPLFVMGRNDGISAVLRDVIRPRVAYVAAKSDNLPAVAAHYRVSPGPPKVRMWVTIVDCDGFVA